MGLYGELGMVLIPIGAVLIVDGLWLVGRGTDQDVAMLNLFVGAISFILAMWWAFGNSEGTPFNAAGTLLFAFTYLWVGANAYQQQDDQRSLGWYCILVTAFTIPTGFLSLQAGDLGLAILWWFWGSLWATFWILLGLQKEDYSTPIAWYTIVVGIVTAAVGYLMGIGSWP